MSLCECVSIESHPLVAGVVAPAVVLVCYVAEARSPSPSNKTAFYLKVMKMKPVDRIYQLM